jgi:hypothetical protein
METINKREAWNKGKLVGQKRTRRNAGNVSDFRDLWLSLSEIYLKPCLLLRFRMPLFPTLSFPVCFSCFFHQPSIHFYPLHSIFPPLRPNVLTPS